MRIYLVSISCVALALAAAGCGSSGSQPSAPVPAAAQAPGSPPGATTGAPAGPSFGLKVSAQTLGDVGQCLASRPPSGSGTAADRAVRAGADIGRCYREFDSSAETILADDRVVMILFDGYYDSAAILRPQPPVEDMAQQLSR